MCVIIYKQKGYELGKKQYEAAFENNPDGWGVMWAEGGKVRIERGLTKESFMDAVMKVRGKEAVIHTRWATHGTKGVENTHPFKAAKNVWMMHNGIIDIPEIVDGWSDTRHFAEFLIEPVLAKRPAIFGSSKFGDFVEAVSGGGSKFVFLRSDGTVQIVNEKAGQWISKGVWVSNVRSVLPRNFVWTVPAAKTTSTAKEVTYHPVAQPGLPYVPQPLPNGLYRMPESRYERSEKIGRVN